MHIPMCTIQHPTGSGARLISLWANGDAAILWNDTEYRYRGVNAFDALAIFTANRSMGGRSPPSFPWIRIDPVPIL
jgi:hypothetical protein